MGLSADKINRTVAEGLTAAVTKYVPSSAFGVDSRKEKLPLPSVGIVPRAVPFTEMAAIALAGKLRPDKVKKLPGRQRRS